MYYYVCKRCNYVSKQKIDIKRHLDKKKKCKLNPENMCILSNDEMYNLSLEKQEALPPKKTNKNITETTTSSVNDKYINDIINNNIQKTGSNSYTNKICTHTAYLDNENHIQKLNRKEEIITSNTEQNIIVESNIQKLLDNDDDSKHLCVNCYRYFSTKSNLIKHQNRKICKMMKKDITIHNNQETKNQHINNQQTINIININMNGIKGFDEDWDVSKIDIKKKIDILLSKYKFSKTLDNILSNDANLNVIINNDIGVVYKSEKNKYEPMAKKEIMEKSMDKIYKHLKDFYEDIKESDIKEYSDNALDILSNEYNDIELKYTRYNKLEESKTKGDEALMYYYNKIKTEAEKKYYEMIEDEDINNY
jgi:hypothetical protein